MIINAVPPVKTLVTLLEESKFQFYQTGSQFLGGFTEKSDRDFFVRDSAEVRKFLRDLRFAHLPITMVFNLSEEDLSFYQDPSLTDVMERSCAYEGRKIQIQLIKPEFLRAKIRVNQFLRKHKPNQYLLSTPKRERRWVWRALILREKEMLDQLGNENWFLED